MKLNNIKNKFEDREIQPSADAWDRLSTRLDGEENKSKKPLVYWISAVAAIFILGLMIVPTLMNDNEGGLDNAIVIDTPEIEEVIKKEDTVDQQVMPSSSIIKDEAIVATKTEKAIDIKEAVTIKKKKPVVPVKVMVNKNSDIALTIISKKPIEIDPIQEAVAQRELPDTIVKEAIPVKSEADALLDRALINIKNQSTAVAARREINPQRLLRETEWDLQAQKRNRLENTLLDGLGRLKREAVALIDRNQ